jgi:hypothetical protein
LSPPGIADSPTLSRALGRNSVAMKLRSRVSAGRSSVVTESVYAALSRACSAAGMRPGTWRRFQEAASGDAFRKHCVELLDDIVHDQARLHTPVACPAASAR